jgi:hypothetical protein
MNDFTKEELQDLLTALDYSGWVTKMNCKNTPSLISKIQSMVDNYCDHKHSQLTSNSEYGIFVKCVKCKKVI